MIFLYRATIQLKYVATQDFYRAQHNRWKITRSGKQRTTYRPAQSNQWRAVFLLDYHVAFSTSIGRVSVVFLCSVIVPVAAVCFGIKVTMMRKKNSCPHRLCWPEELRRVGLTRHLLRSVNTFIYIFFRIMCFVFVLINSKNPTLGTV